MPDWLSFLLWYLVVSALGLIGWPLAFHFLRELPSRGWALSKALGLLLGGYVFWLFGSLGFLTNTVGGIILAAAVVALLSAWASRKVGFDSLRHFAIRNSQFLIVSEVLFFFSFALWAFVRAHNPEIVATEKPMEFAFLNAIGRSQFFPPLDPWLSGYAISYYYFGYVIVAMLTKLTAADPGVAFNLGVSLLFGLVAVGSWGVVFDLIATARKEEERRKKDGGGDSMLPSSSFLLPALLAPLFVLVIGNLGGFLEVLHSRHVFWREVPTAEGADLESSFWKWLDLEELSDPPIGPPSWTSQRYLWWWRSSRVIRDRDLNSPPDASTGWQFEPEFKFLGHEGTPIGLQPIDEFPMFSFLLGDMHPHVLALPFVLLALAFAFNLHRRPSQFAIRQSPVAFGLYALVLGSLSFLNTWDFPIYLFVTLGAYSIGRLREGGRWEVLRDSALVAFGLLLLGILLYLPFYLGFQSQAGGLLPNFVFPTRLPQFFVMFGPLLAIVLILLGWLAWRERQRANWPLLPWTFALIGVPIVALAIGLGASVLARPDLMAYVNDFLGPISPHAGIALTVRRRLLNPWLPLLLVSMVGVVASLLVPRRKTEAVPSRSPISNLQSPIPNPQSLTPNSSISFCLLLVAVASLLTLGPEFLYLKDNFGARMNTVFKFYYQAWVQWGLVAAFAVWYLSTQLRSVGRIAFQLAAASVIGLGLVYPLLGIWTKANGFKNQPTLDGFAYMKLSSPADYEAIVWLRQNVSGAPVIAEAIGGQYSEYARVSASTGLPTVMGWGGHEGQWRGAQFGQQAGSREPDIDLLYKTRSWEQAEEILKRYDIRYVYYGRLETGKYGLGGAQKFDAFMQPVYQADGVTIYEIPNP